MEDLKEKQNITAFLHLLARFRDEDASIYNSMAPGYERFAQPWDNAFARPALDHLLTRSAKRIAKGGRIMDAGCGTGLRIPDIIKHFQPAEIVAIDLSEAMLNMAQRKDYAQPVTFARENLLSLPYEDESFDGVVATWTLETMGNPGRAVQEFLRVIKPEGIVAYSFVQIPKSEDIYHHLPNILEDQINENLREALSPEHLPFHDCPVSEIHYFANGMISTVILGKCCKVSSRILPKPFDEFEI